MEFLVDMRTQVPDGTTQDAVDAVRQREAAHSRDLAGRGDLRRLWRPPLNPMSGERWAFSRPMTATNSKTPSPRCHFGSGAPTRSPDCRRIRTTPPSSVLGQDESS